MIDERKIEEAAEYSIKTINSSKRTSAYNGIYIYDESYKDGFKDGVRWAATELKQPPLWHDVSEEPITDIVGQNKDVTITFHNKCVGGWKEKFATHNIESWCYRSDLNK